MTITHTFRGITFEWDDAKASANVQKHGVGFQTACEVFFDPFLHVEDAGAVESEARDAVIGLTVSWRLLYVVHITREDGIIRIFSARTATESERKAYEDG